MLISVFTTFGFSQCLPVFKPFSPYPTRQGLSGYYTLQDPFRSPYNFLKVPYTDGTRPNPGLTRMNLWNGKKWDTISIPPKTAYFMVYDSTYYVSCKLETYNGISAPAGKYFTMLYFSNNKWDTVPGATLDTAIANYTGEYVANPLGIFFESEKPKTKNGAIFQYTRSSKKCLKIIDYERVLYSVDLIASPKRILIAKIGKVNGKSVSGFAYIDSAGIHAVANNNFDATMIYGIDVNTDNIYAFDYEANPDIRIFSDKLVARYSTTVPHYSSNGDAQIIDGKIVWVGYSSNQITLIKILCPGETRWKVIALDPASAVKFANVSVTQQGVFGIGGGNIYYLGNGSSVYGHAYVDLSSNCIKDSTDPNISNRLVTLRNNNKFYSGLIDSSGNFEVFVLPDTYAISGPYNLAKCMNGKVSVITSGKRYSRDLALQNPGYHDLSVKNYTPDAVRWNTDAYYVLELENVGEPADSAHFTVTLDPKLKIRSSDPQIDSIKDNKAFGKVYGLKYFDTRKIKFSAWIDTATTKPDTILCHKMQGYLYVTEKDNSNNGVRNCQKIVYSFDPNQISVDKSEIPPFRRETLIYRIDFENEGSDDAHDVTIADTLSPNLSLDKIEILSSSHFLQLQVGTEGNLLNFYFKDIYLKPKKKDSILSKGFIVFKVNTRDDLLDGDSIINKAYIYFDLNKPVITNTAITRIRLMEANTQKVRSEMNSLIVYPNPANEIFHVGPPTLKRDIRIYTIQGTLIYQTSQKKNEVVQISTLNWDSGIYILQAGNSSTRIMILK
jgi:hypothetical protein